MSFPVPYDTPRKLPFVIPSLSRNCWVAWSGERSFGMIGKYVSAGELADHVIYMCPYIAICRTGSFTYSLTHARTPPAPPLPSPNTLFQHPQRTHTTHAQPRSWIEAWRFTVRCCTAQEINTSALNTSVMNKGLIFIEAITFPWSCREVRLQKKKKLSRSARRKLQAKPRPGDSYALKKELS